MSDHLDDLTLDELRRRYNGLEDHKTRLLRQVRDCTTAQWPLKQEILRRSEAAEKLRRARAIEDEGEGEDEVGFTGTR